MGPRTVMVDPVMSILRLAELPERSRPGARTAVIARTIQCCLVLAGWSAAVLRADLVPIQVVDAPVAMVVAGHPEATAAGIAVLRAGGNAVDAAVAVSLALGVAEPYGSGLGGKIMLLYYEAATGRTRAIEGLDQAPAGFDLNAYRAMPAERRRSGWSAVAIPGNLAGLAAAHRRWGERAWAMDVAPAVALARTGAVVLAKSRDQFAEEEAKLRADAGMAGLFLPEGRVPAVGTRLPTPALARTLAAIADGGAAAFYSGDFARAAVAAAAADGVVLSMEDFANYAAREVEPVRGRVFGVEVVGSPPPTTGIALVLPMLKALEPWGREQPERSSASLARIGEVWRRVQPEVAATVADGPGGAAAVAALLSPEAIARFRGREPVGAPAVSWHPAVEADWTSDQQSTTHFVIVDAAGNAVSVTQSLSLHFGAGVVAPGTGVVLNDSLSNFAYQDPTSPNLGAPGKRPRSTIAPALVLRDGRLVLAIGLPGGQRIPTALFQVLFDHLGAGRELAAAIGDVRWHLLNPRGGRPARTWEVEGGLPTAVAAGLRAEGWLVEEVEVAGTGHHFGGFAAIEIQPDGTRRGFADTRRTNAAAGY